ncbi:MAG: TolC family protein, partial [Syntrophomonadaceae bacterium]|nr:TolC family protein [Syntrophomonadaceae bacterium]
IDLESAQMSDDLMSAYYGGGTWDARQVKQALIAAQLAEQDAKAVLLNSVYTSYETYGMLTEQYAALTKVLELTKEAYRLQQLTYEVGLSTFEDVNKSEDDLRQAEANLAECVYNYNVLKSAFKYNVYKAQ